MKAMDMIRQITPPLLLLPLFDAPWDASGLFWWMIGVPAATVSLFTLLFGISRTEPGQPTIRWESMLRPVLTIAIVSGATATGLLVLSNTEQYVGELASSLQRACKDQGRCPVAPRGWRTEGRYGYSTKGHWRLTYVANSSSSEFGLWVGKDRDNELCIHGGSLIALSEIKSVHCKSDPNVPSRAF